MSYNGLYYPAYSVGFDARPRLHSAHPFRNILAAGSNMNNHWPGTHGYGLEPPDYDYHSGPSAHMPSGGSYSYHATAGTGYGPPPTPAVHPPVKQASGTGSGGKKGIFGGSSGKRNSSAMSALTLLSFLFFINLLQSCIKDHMDAMNPTVMVMTPTIIRNRFNKMGEMNSREQSSTFTSSAANIVMKPSDLVAAAVAQSPLDVETARPSVNLHPPYESKPDPQNKPIEQPISQPPSQYVHKIPEAEISINYPKPQFDFHKPDPYTYAGIPHQQQSISYDNHTMLVQPPPPPHRLTPVEQQYNYHHTEYYAQPSALPPMVAPQYSMHQNIFQEHQVQSVSTKPHSEDFIFQHGATSSQDYDIHQKYEMQQQQQNQHHSQPTYTNEEHPWSSNSHPSSVVSGPFRKASIIAVSPKTRWITVPARITDRAHFERNFEDALEHHG